MTHWATPFLKVPGREASFATRGFHLGDNATQQQLETIGRKFLEGYHQALRYSRNEALVAALATEKAYQGFAWEGAAMARTLTAVLNLKKGDPLQPLLQHQAAARHVYMLHVGAGWAFARLPVRLEQRITAFHPLHRWLVVDGYGFHQAYFKTKKYVYNQALPKELKQEAARHAFYQGLGRCLWFIECGDPERVAARIRSFDSAWQGDLWSGTGLAATYACGVPEPVIRELAQAAGAFAPDLAQGSAFAAAARHRAGNPLPENEMACRLLTGLSIEAAAAAAEEATAGIDHRLPSAQQYAVWRLDTRSTIQKKTAHETQTTAR